MGASNAISKPATRASEARPSEATRGQAKHRAMRAEREHQRESQRRQQSKPATTQASQ